jgi:hypothetical protein
MDKNLDIITYAVSLIIKAVIMAGRFSGTVRKWSLRRLAAMDKRTKKQQKKPRYTIRERLSILWHMETFQIPRRKVTEHLKYKGH